MNKQELKDRALQLLNLPPDYKFEHEDFEKKFRSIPQYDLIKEGLVQLLNDYLT